MSVFSREFWSWRLSFILLLILLAVFGLIARIYFLMILNQSFLRHQSDERSIRFLHSPAFRGMIMDRNGYPLAVSAEVFSVWVSPKEFKPLPTEWNDILKRLQLDPVKTNRQWAKQVKKEKSFWYLKRGVAPDVVKDLKSLHVQGLHFMRTFKRYYPDGEVAAHLLGFTNVDDQGQEGLELYYNDWLKGKDGSQKVEKDRLGRVITKLNMTQQLQHGNDLVLSIDRRMQYLAYRELLLGVKKYKAQSGSVIILDVNTGEVLAMVNLPSYNPNRAEHAVDSLRNRAITDLFEPGSTIKAFTVAAALSSGRYHPNTIIDTAPGWIRVGRGKNEIVRDEHYHHDQAALSVAEVFQRSSNVGVTKMVLSLPPNHLWKLLHQVGFGDYTGIAFPGEQRGVLVNRDPWPSFALATLSFGYGLSVTALQLTQAYAVVANSGVKIPVSLLKVDRPPRGEVVMTPEVAQHMLTLMESVVSGKAGTARLARVPGYRIAGKTGTSKKAIAGGYAKRYISSFVGIAPRTRPRLVVAVVIHDPSGKDYYGGSVSAPVFEKIMEASLRLLNIPPDDEEKIA